ncbi:SpoIIE family protein phosphatase [Streptomyces fuscigenes]|uniref:SpoIIE family protein phosphatase n=1 Tax=Streptomyces fuscigenes TaxID=1528880 RepID=UPI001F39A6EC|nr:SpoIIE family protein phosphatase [Streptomyces fuscigenes]MCF3964965.1 SpoIIE family protein phosphatase [Streptomyces fuscigenes]
MRSVPAPQAGRRATSEALEAELRAELPGAMARSGMGAFLWDVRTGRVYMHPGALAVFGLKPDEFDGQVSTLARRVIPREMAELRKAVQSEGFERTGLSFHFRACCRPRGQTRWAHAQVQVIRDGRGSAQKVVGVIRDASAELQGAVDQATSDAVRRRQSDVVHATTAALAKALTFDDVLESLNDAETLRGIGAAGIALTTFKEDGDPRLVTKGLPAVVFRGFEVLDVEAPTPFAEVVRTQQPLFVRRPDFEEKYPLMWPNVEESPVTSTAIAPLVAQGRPTGALTVLYEGRTSFTSVDRDLLLALGSAVAQSLQRARLYDHEHAVAVGLQRAMLPARIPRVEGLETAVHYQPSSNSQEVGGDWYDAVPLPDGGIALIVGDVEGHDFDASAVMGQLRTALRAYASEGHPPSTVMARASAFLTELETDRLATCVYVAVTPRTGEALLARAGHPDPFVRYANGDVAHLEVDGGLPLGMPGFATAPHPTTRLLFERGDTLLLCTDGLLESGRRSLDAGCRRVVEAMAEGPVELRALAAHIVGAVADSRGQEDDVALLLATLSSPGPERGSGPDSPGVAAS